MQELAGGEAIRVQAADWILKQRLEGSWSEQDQRELDSWLAQSTANFSDQRVNCSSTTSL